jgi:hypothetical protein
MGVATKILAIVVGPSSLLSAEGWGSELATLNLIAAVTLVGLALAWGRHGRRWLFVASGFTTVVAVTLLYWLTVRPSDIPIDWVTVLHHSLGRKTIMHLYTRGVHAGLNFAFILSAVAAGHPTLHDVVWLNLLLALVNAAIFLHLAVYVTGPAWAIPWTLVFALNPATFLASFSELPTNLLALYFLAAVIAWAVLIDPLPQPRVLRGVAYALCAVLSVLVALTRFEVAFLGAVALAVHAGYALLGSDVWSAAWRRLRSAGEWLLVFFSDHPAAVAVLCLVGVWLSWAGLPGLVGRAPVAGLYPFNPSILSLYVFLPMLLLPIGVSIAILFGCIPAIERFRQFGGLALSLFVLVRMYFAAEYQYFEMGRYLSYILPAIFLLGLFGKAQFDDMASRWHPNWRRAARIGYLMAWFTLPLPGMAEYYERPEYHRNGGFSQLLLDLNTQREVRYLMALTEKNPQCVFVSRVVEDQHGNPRVATHYDYIAFGAPLVEPILVPEKEVPLEQFVARYASGAPCVRLYSGGDCNLNFADHCRSFVAGRRLVEEYRFWSRPYNNPLQSGYGAPEIVLRTYAWP